MGVQIPQPLASCARDSPWIPEPPGGEAPLSPTTLSTPHPLPGRGLQMEETRCCHRDTEGGREGPLRSQDDTPHSYPPPAISAWPKVTLSPRVSHIQ